VRNVQTLRSSIRTLGVRFRYLDGNPLNDRVIITSHISIDTRTLEGESAESKRSIRPRSRLHSVARQERGKSGTCRRDWQVL